MSIVRKVAKTIAKQAFARVARVPPVPHLITHVNLIRYQSRPERRLEIGPGGNRLAGFETMNIVPGIGVDYVGDAAGKLPFLDETFDLIYASHILEHIPWFQTAQALREWVRVLRPGGALEIWVPDGLKICETLVQFERNGVNEIEKDGWYKFNPDHDPCTWAAGRLYTYGDGSGRIDHPNWHHSLFTPRYLRQLLERAGLEKIRQMQPAEVRGNDHGWINLGFRGTKPAAAGRVRKDSPSDLIQAS